MSPFDLLNIVRAIKRRTQKKFTGTAKSHRLMRFFFASYVGMIVPLLMCLYGLYYIAPVWTHGWLFSLIKFGFPFLISAGILWLGVGVIVRYSPKDVDGWRGYINAVTVGSVLTIGFLIGGLMVSMNALESVQIYRDSQFQEINDLPRVSNKHVRYTPAQVAAEEIIRRTQTSEFTPGDTRPIGSKTGVAYIAPLVPQGMWNSLLQNNASFMYFEDGGLENDKRRVTDLTSAPFEAGEGMEVFDDIYRRLLHEVGFFNDYPEIYYTPLYSDKGTLTEIIGVVPYISYRFGWGTLIPKWGGVAIFHANGDIEDFTPEEALADPRLATSQRLFPGALARKYVEVQRYDQGDSIISQMWGGLVRRPGKIEIPVLPGKVQIPYFLPMEDGSYQYLATVEPDGEAHSLMRVYFVNAQTGERLVYRYDVPNRPKNLQGPQKVISYVKALPNYVWLEGEGSGETGTYRIVEPRPVTPQGQDHLFWMLSITPADYASVVATVFVDSATNVVHGPFKNREETFAFLQGRKDVGKSETVIVRDSERFEKMCSDMEAFWTTHCGPQKH